MKILRIGALAALVVVTAGAAQAQDPTHPRAGGRHKGGEMGHMGQELGLTDAQRQQIRAIHERHRAQLTQLRTSVDSPLQAAAEARRRGDTAAVRANHEQARAAAQQTRDQRRQLHETMQAEIRAILTPEQQAKFDVMRERREMMRGMRQRGGEMRPRGPRSLRAAPGTRGT